MVFPRTPNRVLNSMAKTRHFQLSGLNEAHRWGVPHANQLFCCGQLAVSIPMTKPGC